MFDTFPNDPQDRKRRFLRGLNVLLGYEKSEDKDISLSSAIRVSVGELRNRLERIYGLEFSKSELKQIMHSGLTTGDFTEKYCPIIYNSRPGVDVGTLVSNAMDRSGAVDLREMDSAPKYGLNGSEWCDVATGPCSCGAGHK